MSPPKKQTKGRIDFDIRPKVRCVDCAHLGEVDNAHHFCPKTKMVCYNNQDKICVYYAKADKSQSKASKC